MVFGIHYVTLKAPVAKDTMLTSLNIPEMRYSVVFGIHYLTLKITLKAPLAADTRPKSLDFPGVILLFGMVSHTLNIQIFTNFRTDY